MSAQVDQARDAVDAALLQIGTADAATDRVVGVIRAQTGINALIAAVRAEERQQPSDAFAMACLTADRVELQRQLAEERQTRSALVENAKIVLKGFGQNVFVRNTDGDGDSGWAIKVLPYIAALARLELALTRAGETK